MRTIQISDDDIAQVNAILRMHADMQDMRSVQSMELMGRLMRDEPVDAAETIEDLQDQVETFEEDRDNLNRIANIFM